MEAKIFCIRRNLGGHQTRDRAAGVGVQVETCSLAMLEMEERGASNHRRVVGGQSRAGREDSSTLGLEPGSHRRREPAIAGNATAEYDTLARKRAGRARSLLDESVDQRILESAGDVGFVCLNIGGVTNGVENRRLDAAE